MISTTVVAVLVICQAQVSETKTITTTRQVGSSMVPSTDFFPGITGKSMEKTETVTTILKRSEPETIKELNLLKGMSEKERLIYDTEKQIRQLRTEIYTLKKRLKGRHTTRAGGLMKSSIRRKEDEINLLEIRLHQINHPESIKKEAELVSDETRAPKPINK